MPRRISTASFFAVALYTGACLIGSVPSARAQTKPPVPTNPGNPNPNNPNSPNNPNGPNNPNNPNPNGNGRQTPGNPNGQPDPNRVPQKTNPLLDTSTQRLNAPPLPMDRTPFTDYRQSVNPELQRSARVRTDELPLFGFNYFEPARRAILARRAYFARLVSGQEQVPVSPQSTADKNQQTLKTLYDNPNAPLTQEDKDAVAALTPSQQLDLLLRQRDNKLTDAERIKYRALLNPPRQDQVNPPPGQVQLPPDESATLTPEQKIDLIKRMKADQLTPDEKVRYRKFLIPQGDVTGGGGVGFGAAALGGNYTGITATGNQGVTTGYGGGLGNGSQFAPYGAGGVGQPGGNGGASLQFPTGQGYQSIPGPGQPGFSGSSGQFGGSPAFPAIAQPTVSPQDLRLGSGSMSAFSDIIDPIAQLYQNVSATVPVNYQLAGGDKVILRISSPVLAPIETPLSVDPTGAVMVPNVGRVIVLGQTLSQAESAIAARLTRIYRNATVSLAMQELRTIPVTVAGESFAPGTYQVPAVATAFNVIYATGGPSEEGTMRGIEVRRRGNIAGNHTIDFYKFLLTGDQTTDVQLQAGDVIYIPGRQGVATVSGEVRRPARFEINIGESLKDLLRYAGGVKPSGVSQRVQVATLQPGSARLLKDVDVSALPAVAPVPVYDGDAVDVFSVRETLTNIVTVEGAVDQPGQYAITPRMTVADLVEHARGLIPEAYPTEAQLYRWNADNTLTLITVNLEKALARDPGANIPLTRWDRLSVFTREQVAWTGQREVTVRGAVQKPGVYYRSDNMRVKDLLMLAGGTVPEAYTDQAYVLHQKPDGGYSYEFVNLAAALKDDPKSNVLVGDRDVLAVYRADEARFVPVHQVSIQGEVVTPGLYARGDNMKLSDAIKIAGGLTPRAGERVLVAHARREEGAEPLAATYAPESAVVTPDPPLQDGDVVTIQGRGTYQDRPFVVNITGAVNRPGPVVLRGRKVRLSEVLKQAGGLKPEAYPEGVEFFRSPTLLTTDTQTQITGVVNKLNDILNVSERERARARADIERIKAIGKAGQANQAVALPGVTTSAEPPNPALAQGTASIFSHELVTPARQMTADDLKPHGNVAVDLAKAMQHPGSDDDVIMQDGDTVTVPERPTTITVMGAVVQSRGVVFREGAKLDYYLSEVGGLTVDAAKDRILVVRVGGGLVPIKEVKQFKPGDIIFVPTKVVVANLGRPGVDWDSFFKSLTTSAIVFLLAKNLFGL
jgi:protein involved in polysaccharide export with SLBB domain